MGSLVVVSPEPLCRLVLRLLNGFKDVFGQTFAANSYAKIILKTYNQFISIVVSSCCYYLINYLNAPRSWHTDRSEGPLPAISVINDRTALQKPVRILQIMVVSDKCEPVSTRTERLLLMPHRDQATPRGQRHG